MMAKDDPMKFSSEVYEWMKDAHAKVAEFADQMGTPALAVDAHALQHLTQIRRDLEQAVADLGTQLPAPQVAEEPAPRSQQKKASA
jgi:hypothetical protein